MGISDRKARQKDELKQKVLKVAEQLFVKDGYQNVSMRKIAEKIEYSPTTIYRLFENKADIIEQLIADGYASVFECYEEILSNQYTSPLQTFNEIIKEYIKFGINNPNHYELWFSSSDLTEKNGKLMMTHGRTQYQVYQTWFDLIDECKEKKFMNNRKTNEIFQIIWSGVHGIISLRINYPKIPWMPLDKHIEQLTSQKYN